MSGERLRRKLTVVMPVYNEEGCIRRVVHDWLRVLSEAGITFQLLLIDDGSRDRTPEELDALLGDSRVTVVHKPNEGHGPTIVKGYGLACVASEWVFHADSDDEIPAAAFPGLWAQRTDHDVVVGVRSGRRQTWGRRVLSWGSRLIVRCVAGERVQDANSPFRLIRSACLAPMLAVLSPGMFAPNVAIMGLAFRWGFRVALVPVPCRPRGTGVSSMRIRRLPGIGARSLIQVGLVLLRHRAKP